MCLLEDVGVNDHVKALTIKFLFLPGRQGESWRVDTCWNLDLEKSGL